MIVAPHDVNEERIKKLMEKTKNKAILFSSLNSNNSSRILIMDKIGYLSSIYRYGQIAYIGGGFGNGIHNTLEAAVYGLPIIFGPNYEKFKEAKEMVEQKSAFSINSIDDLDEKMTFLFDDSNKTKVGQKNMEYVISQQGATNIFLSHLEEVHIISTL
jgi:3-deoxy-D-manno-octulosonic-acid transferase